MEDVTSEFTTAQGLLADVEADAPCDGICCCGGVVVAGDVDHTRVVTDVLQIARDVVHQIWVLFERSEIGRQFQSAGCGIPNRFSGQCIVAGVISPHFADVGGVGRVDQDAIDFKHDLAAVVFVDDFLVAVRQGLGDLEHPLVVVHSARVASLVDESVGSDASGADSASGTLDIVSVDPTACVVAKVFLGIGSDLCVGG